jgi:hypothetical protein
MCDLPSQGMWVRGSISIFLMTLLLIKTILFTEGRPLTTVEWRGNFPTKSAIARVVARVVLARGRGDIARVESTF